LHHPDAAQALREWASKDPRAARKVFAWDGLHPEQTKALVDWAIKNPGDDVVAFRTKHQDWPEFPDPLHTHRAAPTHFPGAARPPSGRLRRRDRRRTARGAAAAGRATAAPGPGRGRPAPGCPPLLRLPVRAMRLVDHPFRDRRPPRAAPVSRTRLRAAARRAA